MARIRSIKPEFFRDEELQDLEAAHPGCYPMLVYAGLWGHCDKNGTFEWRPKQLKLDILPFLPFEMARSLDLLEAAGFIKKFEALGKQWGNIHRFRHHQRISGSEASDPSKYPEYQEPTEEEAPGKQPGSTGDNLVSQEGKGREGKGRGEDGPAKPPPAPPQKRGSPLPEEFEITPDLVAWAKPHGWAPYLPAYLEYLRDWAKSKRAIRIDWTATFRNCVRADWGNIRRANGAHRTEVTRPAAHSTANTATVLAEAKAALAARAPMPDSVRAKVRGVA